MTKAELLNTYRTKVIELEELRYQLSRVGTDGRPSGCRTAQMDARIQGANMPGAAALQLADGLEALVRKKEGEMQALAGPVSGLLAAISDARTYLIVQHYYILGRTDEEIGRTLAISRTRANQLRLGYLKAA